MGSVTARIKELVTIKGFRRFCNQDGRKSNHIINLRCFWQCSPTSDRDGEWKKFKKAENSKMALGGDTQQKQECKL